MQFFLGIIFPRKDCLRCSDWLVDVFGDRRVKSAAMTTKVDSWKPGLDEQAEFPREAKEIRTVTPSIHCGRRGTSPTFGDTRHLGFVRLASSSARANEIDRAKRSC